MNLEGVDRAELLVTQVTQVVAGEVAILEVVHDVVLAGAHLAAHGTVELGQKPRVNLYNVAFQIEPVA